MRFAGWPHCPAAPPATAWCDLTLQAKCSGGEVEGGAAGPARERGLCGASAVPPARRPAGGETPESAKLGDCRKVCTCPGGKSRAGETLGEVPQYPWALAAPLGTGLPAGMNS